MRRSDMRVKWTTDVNGSLRLGVLLHDLMYNAGERQETRPSKVFLISAHHDTMRKGLERSNQTMTNEDVIHNEYRWKHTRRTKSMRTTSRFKLSAYHSPTVPRLVANIAIDTHQFPNVCTAIDVSHSSAEVVKGDAGTQCRQ